MGPQPRLTRRAVLLGALAVAACSPTPEAIPSVTAPPSTGPDPDALLREDVAVREWALISLYDAAIAGQPALGTQLGVLRDQHREHAQALGSSAPPPLPSGSVPSVPASASPAEVARLLSDIEQRAAGERTDACGAASDPDLARVLALIAASEASHSEALRRTA